MNLFAAVYLYQLGYSIVFIALFYASIYAIKIPASYVFARIAAYFGPKHGIFFANLLRIPSLIAFALAPQVGLPAVIVFGVLQQLASGLYDLCYMVDFSKIKSFQHAGKEIGIMQALEKAARIVSPLVGGAVAALYGVQATIVLASIVFAIAALPLFRTIEPVATRSRLHFHGFPWRLARSSLVSESVVGFDFVASGVVWLLFVTIAVFAATGQALYAVLGGLASFGVFVSMIAAWTFGKLVDKHRGGILLSAGTIANVIIHAFRPFVSTPAGVVAANMANETATSAYALPFTRVLFDVADSSGFRIPYLMLIEMAVSFGCVLGCLLLAWMVTLFGVIGGMQAVFVIAALYELLLLGSSRPAR